jgi:hypothetical protein
MYIPQYVQLYMSVYEGEFVQVLPSPVAEFIDPVRELKPAFKVELKWG